MTLLRARKKVTLMGITHVSATVKPVLPGGSSVTADFLVDTGAIDCLLPGSLLRQAGVEPDRADFYELADGSLIELPVAHARIEFMGCHVIVKVVFGPENTEPILGAIALEDAGFVVDPAKQRLRRLAARSLKKAGHERLSAV
jgi:clan AA aspartic protease